MLNNVLVGGICPTADHDPGGFVPLLYRRFDAAFHPGRNDAVYGG